MFQWFKQWREARGQAAFKRGYDLVNEELLAVSDDHGTVEPTLLDFENKVDAAKIFGDYNSFDQGIEAAVKEFRAGVARNLAVFAGPQCPPCLDPATCQADEICMRDQILFIRAAK